MYVLKIIYANDCNLGFELTERNMLATLMTRNFFRVLKVVAKTSRTFLTASISREVELSFICRLVKLL